MNDFGLRLEPSAMVNARHQALQASMLAAAIESLRDAVVCTDDLGQVIVWSAAAARLFGYSADEILGRSIECITPPRLRHEQRNIFASIRRGDQPPPYLTVGLHKYGRELEVEVSPASVRDNDGHLIGIAAVIRDIAQQLAQQRERDALYRLTDQLLRAHTEEIVYEAALSAISEALDCDRAAILLFDDVGVMKFVAARGLSRRYQQAVEGHSPWNPAADRFEPVLIPDVAAAILQDGLKSIVCEEGIGALSFIPLLSDGKLIGKFMVYYDGPHAFRPSELELSQSIANQIAFGIKKVRGEEAKANAETAARASESKLAAEARALTELNKASAILWSLRDIREGLRIILGAAIELVAADKGIIQLKRPGERLELYAHHGFDPSVFHLCPDPEDSRGLASERALRTASPVFIEDTELDASYAPYRHIARQYGYRALHAFPIVGRAGISVGVVGLHFKSPTRPDGETVKRLDLYLRQAADFIERCQLDAALLQSINEQKVRTEELQAVMDAAPAIIWIAHDVDCRRITGNVAAQKLLRVRAFQNQSLSAPPPEAPEGFEVFADGRRLEPHELPVQRAARGELVTNFEEEVRFSDGCSHHLLGNAVPLRNADGSPRGSIAAFVDITERRRVEAERELLVAELSHRVKNTLATVLSIEQQSFGKARTLQEGRASFTKRIHALAQTHTRLAEHNWTGVSISTLVRDEMRPYRNEDKRNVRIKGPDLMLSPSTALMLGLGLHELATNAAKYGALSAFGGSVDIAWGLTASNVDIVWRELRGPPVTTPRHSGFGRLLIERGLAAQLEATVELRFEPDGVTCRISIPTTLALVGSHGQ